CGHLAASACERPVHRVGRSRDREQRERREVRLGCAEREESADRDSEDSSREYEERRRVHCTLKVRSTTSPGRPRLAMSCPLCMTWVAAPLPLRIRTSLPVKSAVSPSWY